MSRQVMHIPQGSTYRRIPQHLSL